MPQMAPMYWTFLFITFIILMMMTNTILYFEKTYFKKKMNFKIFKIMNKWEW